MTALPVKENINPIYFKDYSKFEALTKNGTQASFLCRLVHYFKITKYILEDGKKWFTRSREQLAAECHTTTRTIGNYLKQFEQLGYIKRRSKLFKKKHLYITITDKLLCLLGLKRTNKVANNFLIEKENFSSSIYKVKVSKDNIYSNTEKGGIPTNNFSSNTNTPEPTKDTAPDFIAPTPLTHERNQVLTDYTEYEQYTAKERANKNKIFSSNTETTKPDNESACNAKKNDDINRGGIKPTLSDYEEYERFTELSDQKPINQIANKPINTQQNKKTKNTFSSNTKQSQKRHQTKRVSDFIGKALTNVQEKYIASTVRNLGLKTEITKPQQLIDEMKEAALNPKRFSKAKNFKHKINTMAKCIRVGRWRDAVNFEDEHVQNDDTFNPARISVDATTGALTIDAEQSKPKSKYSADDFTQEEEAFWQEIEAKARAKRIERNKL